jgi:uncharacterized protein
MQISISDLRSGPAEVQIDLAPVELGLQAEGFAFPGHVSGHIRFQMVGSRALAQGHLELPIQTTCGRCLASIDRTLRIPVRLVWEKRPQTDDDPEAAVAAAWEAENHEFDYYEEDRLDPSEQFRQLLMAELPDYTLCTDACRGLCPKCGIDRNKATCTCEKDSDEPLDDADWKARLRQIRLG